ncbi:hypothetical protein LAZ67_12002191 [Cordylochernes scorpioides]|uniref:Reverse transcriptase n=1 Tax=Cordylochernes scorpioides TaxID=51811 RepID=A0ABY6L422_9ARAC|nr:hypothetical protein LAZ67_12002191 [Cordylochernes scorpioides]
MYPDENWKDYLHRSEKLLENARIMGATIDDEEFIYSVIKGLPQKYNIIAMQINTVNNPTLSDNKSQFFLYQERESVDILLLFISCCNLPENIIKLEEYVLIQCFSNTRAMEKDLFEYIIIKYNRVSDVPVHLYHSSCNVHYLGCAKLQLRVHIDYLSAATIAGHENMWLAFANGLLDKMNFTNQIQSAMHTAGMQVVITPDGPKSKPWFVRECYLTKKALKSQLKIYIRSNSESDRKAYALLKKKYSSLLAGKKKTYYIEIFYSKMATVLYRTPHDFATSQVRFVHKSYTDARRRVNG